jgi:hypothetical protein
MYYAVCGASTHCQVKFCSEGSMNTLQPHNFVEEIRKVRPALNLQDVTTITLLFAALALSQQLCECSSVVKVVCWFCGSMLVS